LQGGDFVSNAAYLDEYKKRWNDCQPLFISNNLEQSKKQCLSAQYSVHINEYNGGVGNSNLHGSECSLVNRDGKTVSEWRSIDNDGEFYKIIGHSNGKEYLIFRQDLYGYSVLDIDSGEKMQFFPSESLNGGETFIWTDVEYNPLNNVLAVSGCYWACPSSTHLFTFDNPMSEHQKFVDLIECFDGGYDVYDDIHFKKWENSDLHIARFNLETNSKEAAVVTQNEYLIWLHEKGQE